MNIEIKIKNNRYNLDMDDVFCLGNRINNSKRNFLFISKFLGKHIEVKPETCKYAGRLLASLIYGDSQKEYPYKTDENICVLGFAETATGLGMAVASMIENSYYLTTTREEVTEFESILKFEEEHSHATTHKCFPIEKDRLINADKIILVDDEITTGKSMINIIKELKKVTKVQDYIILSILDWRNEEHLQAFDDLSSECDVKVEVLSLISGDIKINDTSMFVDNNDNILEEKQEVIKVHILDRINVKTGYKNQEESFLSDTGRFGVTFDNINHLEEKCLETAKFIQGILGDYEKLLVVGHGENIYIPSRVANYLNGEVYFKTTTRSPIYCCDKEGYPIKQKHVFCHKGVKYYFYNKDEIETNYDKVLLLTEDDLDIKLTNNSVIVRI